MQRSARPAQSRANISSNQYGTFCMNPLHPDQQLGARPDSWDANQAKTATQLRVKSSSLAWSWTGNIFDLPWHILASRHQETPSTHFYLPSFDIGKSPIMWESYCG